jgi:uncharacterized protein YcaQ
MKTHLLDGRTRLPKGKEGVARTIEKLGYLQIDTIAVIQRAHHVALWTRRADYEPPMLDELQARDRRIFEFNGRALFYLPMADFRYFLPRMRRFVDPYGKWEKDRLKKYGHLMKPALERLRQDGPSSSRQLAEKLGTKKTADDMREPTKSALQLLHLRGDVMVTERWKFQRIYDLTERVIPTHVDTSMPAEEEVGRFCVRRALATYGVATEREIREYSHAADRESIAAARRELADNGEVVPVRLEGEDNSDNYALAGTLASARRLKRTAQGVIILSPFDSLVIQRDRLRRLFDFDYALECYVPPARRKYGYFVHPILYGEELVGRLDPKADRRKETLLVQSLYLENRFKATGKFAVSLAERLEQFARFNGCERVKVIETSPPGFKKQLEKELTAIRGG